MWHTSTQKLANIMCTPLNVLVFHLKYHAYNSMICHRHIITLHADCGLSVLRSEFVCRWLWWTVSDFACRLWAVSFMKWLSEDCGLPVSESDIADCGMPVSRSDFFCRLWAFSFTNASFIKWLCVQIVGCQFHKVTLSADSGLSVSSGTRGVNSQIHRVG